MANEADWEIEKIDYCCGLHFVGGKIIGNNNVPSISAPNKAYASDDVHPLTNKDHDYRRDTKGEGEKNINGNEKQSLKAHC